MDTRAAPEGPAALIVSPDGTAEIRHLPRNPAAQLAALNDAVGGYIEAIGDGHWHAYINEEGKLHDLPPNPQADLLARALGWRFGNDYLVGPAVFLGRRGADEADVPERVVQMAHQIGIPFPRQETP